ncbi:MAG: Omp28 family outer membrane lipoprotein [Bacteroidota bacterium]
MKTKIVYLLTVFGLLMQACDYVDQPYIGGNINPADCPAPAFDTNQNQIRYVLFEEFTGHKCVNCPGGTYEIRTVLEPMYGDSLIVVSIHAGGLAAPDAAGTGSFETDFRTDAGEEYFTFFNVSVWPIGMVNRTDNAGSGALYYRPEWANAIAAELTKPLEVNLQMKVEYDSVNNTGCAHVQTEFLSSLSGDFNMVLYVVEDSITDWQINNPAPGGDPTYPTGNVSNYVHRHVLRDVPSGTWGKPVVNGTPAAGDKFINSFSFTIDPNWDEQHVSLVAYIYDFSAQYRTVHQAVEIHLEE